MYRIIRRGKDCYITDRIIDDLYRATDANTGQAATLDLFKLFDESSLNGVDNPVELSRLLVKFDFDAIRALTGSIIDPSDSSFRAIIKLTDVVGGQPVPSNFSVIIHPLSKSWDEGVGRDVARFSDLDVANWYTASVSTGFDAWNAPGASAEGLLGDPNIDIIAAGDLGDGKGLRPLTRTQTFATGEEDLEVDVTDIVSATLAGILPDEGFRIALTGTLEANSSSYFVKRFASFQATNPRIRPTLVVKFDDSIDDNHANFVFDTTGSLFIYNEVRGRYANFVSGVAATPLTGANALTLKLISGAIAPPTSQSFSMTVPVDQFAYGQNYVSGVYVARFAISSFEPALRNEVMLHGSATFHTIWGSNDGTVPFYTGTLIVTRPEPLTHVVQDRQLSVSIPNHRAVYRVASKARVRVNVYDVDERKRLMYSRLPVERVGKIFDRMYWRLVDVYSGEVIIPFDEATRLSTDSKGMFFDFFPEDFSIGRVYGFEFLIVDGNEEIIIDKNLPTFRLEP